MNNVWSYFCHVITSTKQAKSNWKTFYPCFQDSWRKWLHFTHFDGGGMDVTSAWSPLGNFLEGQAHPNLSSNQVFLFFWREVFFVFTFRWFRVFHWGCYVYFRLVFSSNSLYILYIFIFIYFIYFFIVLVVPYSALTDYDRSVVLTLDDRPDPQLWGHCRSTHNSSMICFFVFAVVSLWHPGDGRDVRKKPLPYNYFFTSLF